MCRGGVHSRSLYHQARSRKREDHGSTMHYLHHVHAASACAQTVYLNNFLPSGPCLCRVLHTSLSFIALPHQASSPSTSSSSTVVSPLSEVLSVPINARIIRVEVIISENGGLDKLAVLTDHHQPRLIVLRHRSGQRIDGATAAAKGRLPRTRNIEEDAGEVEDSEETYDDWTPIETESVLLLDEMGRPAAESGLSLQVEQGIGASYMISHTHAGILRVAPLSTSGKMTTINAGEMDLTRAFGVRLPHPHLISSTFLARSSKDDPSTLALLSLSSAASRIPGLGMQCLPVLSFHSIDAGNQELKPVGWGPPRKAPSQSFSLTSPTSPKANRRKSSTSQSSKAENQDMPGSFTSSSQDQVVGDGAASASNSQASASKGKSNGPSAMGINRKGDDEGAREELLARSPLTRAHVPIPFVDALGAHLLLSLPARAGGGVLLFCESAIFHVASPYRCSGDGKSAMNSSKASTSSTVGKRRKASVSLTSSQTSPRQPRRTSTASSSTTVNASALATSPPPSHPLNSSRSNENGKRRRSTAGSQTQPLSPTQLLSTSPTSPRKMSAGIPSWTTRILRLELNQPVIVASAVVVREPHAGQEDDGVRANEADTSNNASLQVLFGTHSGLLHILHINLEKGGGGTDAESTDPWYPIDMSSQPLGSIPAPGGPSAITCLGEGFASIASTGGDSVIIRIADTAGVDDDGDVEMGAKPVARQEMLLEIVHRWANLAPILDFAVDDGAGGDPSDVRSTQARIITASGTGPTGSLRVIKNGVGLEDIATIEEANVHRLWNIESAGETQLIVLGYHAGVRILSTTSTQGGGLGEVTAAFASAGLSTGLPVLEAHSLANDMFVLVNSAEVSVWSINRCQRLAVWTLSEAVDPTLSKASISKAAVNGSGQVLISAKTAVMLLQVDTKGCLGVASAHDMGSEVSALDIHPLAGASVAEYAAIALWSPRVVKIIKLSTWEDATPSSLAATPQTSLVRSVLLHTFSDKAGPTSQPYLLLGLGDGTLNSYGLSLPLPDSLSQRIGVLEKRSTSMGIRPLHLRAFFTSRGLSAVFVSCERPTVVSSYGKGLQYSIVRHREVADVCQFNLQTGTQAEGEAMMLLAKPDGLLVSRMGQIQKTDVATVELGSDNPVSLAICAEAKAVITVCNSFLPEGRHDGAMKGGKAILLDFETFAKLDEFQLELEERANCVELIVINGRSLLAVGTGFTLMDRSETLNGRILLFAIDKQSRTLVLVSSHDVDGNVYAVSSVGDRLVACVNSKVITFDVDGDDEVVPRDSTPSKKGQKSPSPQTCMLMQVGEWACAFTAVTLRVVDTKKLVIGDALRSLVLLRVEESTGRVVELARDCDPYWTIAAEVLDEEEELYIGSDIAFNLWTCSRLKWTEEAKKQNAKSRAWEEEMNQAPSSALGADDSTWSWIMKRQGAYHYGDLINTIKRGSLVPKGGTSNSSSEITPKVVFATAAGAIGVMAELKGRTANALSQLEWKLQKAVQPVGRIAPEDWRTLRTDHRTQKSAGFIDGDFVRTSYEHLSMERRARLLRQGLTRIEAEPDEINSLIESLSRLS